MPISTGDKIPSGTLTKMGPDGPEGILSPVVYGPGTPRGEPLSELLTSDAVIKALKKAAGAPHVSQR